MSPLVIGAIGVVFGDIGTSPLYTLRQCFAGEHPVALTPANVLGILSIIFWALMIIVTAKYVTLIMRADNRGEGGILALTALVSRGLGNHGRRRWWLVGFGIFGAAMFYGDGMITPAISVLGAVEGLEIIAPNLHPFIVPVTVVIVRRAVRDPEARHGERRAPVRPGDVRVVRRARGARRAADRRSIPRCSARSIRCTRSRSSPTIRGSRFLALGAVVLAVTGTEALYADMGHFGAVADPPRVAVVRDAGAGAQLFRAGRAAARESRWRSRIRSTCSRRNGR